MALERLWAGWRASYVGRPDGGRETGCVICRLVAASDDVEALVLERAGETITVMNLYPYGSGHLMVAPVRHTPDLDDLTDEESIALVHALRRAVTALKAAYGPDGLNVGINQGEAAGAGVPGHLHVHVLPRWLGDTNFMTSVAEVRVLPEDLRTGYGKLRAVWPALR